MVEWANRYKIWTNSSRMPNEMMLFLPTTNFKDQLSYLVCFLVEICNTEVDKTAKNIGVKDLIL